MQEHRCLRYLRQRMRLLYTANNNVMYLPNIDLKIDLEKEADMFVSFLHSKTFPQNRESIFQCYPDLKLLLEKNGADEENVIREFIKNKYSEHDGVIKPIVSDSEKMIGRCGKNILEHLSLLMDYTWSVEHTGYLVIPTILPFSPFKGNTIYFSMVRKMSGRNNKEDTNHAILPLLAHEISHLILGDILKHGEAKNLFGSYGWTTKHFLQEILAPILMNQKTLKDILGIENYLGNPYLKHLNIETNSMQENIVVHYEKIYEIMKFGEKRHFTEIIKKMADELESVSVALAGKLKMWNTNGHKLFSNELLLKGYQDPILVKKAPR